MMTMGSSVEIIYEGPGTSTELMGATQANYIVPALDREFAVLVNEPTLQYLRDELGGEDTQEWREDMTRRVGELLIQRKIDRGIHDPIHFVGKRVFEEDPSLLEDLKRSLGE